MVAGQLPPETVANLMKVEPSILLVVAQWGTSVTSQPQSAGSGRWLIYLGDRGRRMATARVAFGSGTWQVMPQVRYLGPDVPSDAATEAETAQTLKAVSAANAEALQRMAQGSVGSQTYTGAAACGTCHAEAYRVWGLSPHARATKDLAIDHQEQNPECLGCHATGLGRAGGLPPTPPWTSRECSARPATARATAIPQGSSLREPPAPRPAAPATRPGIPRLPGRGILEAHRAQVRHGARGVRRECRAAGAARESCRESTTAHPVDIPDHIA